MWLLHTKQSLGFQATTTTTGGAICVTIEIRDLSAPDAKVKCVFVYLHICVFVFPSYDNMTIEIRILSPQLPRSSVQTTSAELDI